MHGFILVGCCPSESNNVISKLNIKERDIRRQELKEVCDTWLLRVSAVCNDYSLIKKGDQSAPSEDDFGKKQSGFCKMF